MHHFLTLFLIFITSQQAAADCYEPGARCAQFFQNGVCYLVDYTNTFYKLKPSPTYSCVTGQPPLEAARTLISAVPPETIQTYNTALKKSPQLRVAKSRGYVPLDTNSQGALQIAKVEKSSDGEAKVLMAEVRSPKASAPQVSYVPTPIPVGKTQPPNPTGATCQQVQFAKIDHGYDNQTKCDQMYDEKYLQSCILRLFCNFNVEGCDAETCARQYYHVRNNNLAAYQKISEVRAKLEKPLDKNTNDFYTICKNLKNDPGPKTKIAEIRPNLMKENKTELAKKYCEAVLELDDRVITQLRDSKEAKLLSCIPTNVSNIHEDIQYIYHVYDAKKIFCYHYGTCNGGKCEDAAQRAGRLLPSSPISK